MSKRKINCSNLFRNLLNFVCRTKNLKLNKHKSIEWVLFKSQNMCQEHHKRRPPIFSNHNKSTQFITEESKLYIDEDFVLFFFPGRERVSSIVSVANIQTNSISTNAKVLNIKEFRIKGLSKRKIEIHPKKNIFT